MERRMIINDIKANKLVSAATCIFMAVTAMLLGLSILLYASLADSIDSLMTEAKTPDFLQMHTGELDEDDVNSFSQQREDIEAMQICTFLNLQNSQISIGNESFENNMQDNGLSCQSSLFDYLVDADNKVIYPSEGEVYVPVCYRKEYGIKSGDVMRIGKEELIVAGFLRDSQMNSMMASSKRFLISEPDYERLRQLGSEEYLIEFRLKDGSDINAFATAYKDAGLPDNGPTITYPLIRMMNALSDGMMILVILLVSVVVLLISMLCIRYIILTQLEKDKTGIGMLKAVGISRRDIRKLYMSKYLILSVVGCMTGVIAAIITAKPVGAQMRELYGNAGNTGLIYALMILGALGAEGVILLSVSRLLHRTDRISAADALYGRGSFGKKKNLWLPAMIITAAAMFMILVPQNMKSTIEAPEFVTYMGIGESHIRIDVRQTGNVRKIAGEVTEDIGHDNRVRDYVLMETGSYRTILQNGSSYDLMIENGDHSRFPVRYTEGRYPENDREIALSVLNAEEMGVKLGDEIIVCKEMKDGTAEEISCSVCGIYSDITNGGKTAKACMKDPDDATPVMWSIIYLSLADEDLTREWTNEYQDRYSSFESGVKVTLIADYLKGTYGQTIRNISKAAAVSSVMACFVLFIVMLLLIRLVVWRERNDSSLKKALGFTSSDIRMEYLKKTVTYILPGIVLGVFAGIVPGQSLAALLLRSMGAYSFRFIIDPLTVFAAAPAMIAVSAVLAAILSLMEVKRIHAWECLRAGALK
ncbi:MAG: ABC transporter permease [Mogibacterium sp.]|nr:ABC transporter permease [Mogibacterium sp.]